VPRRVKVFIFATIVACITSVPYVIAWEQAGDEWRFNGFVYGVLDGNAYLGKMRLGAEGEWQFTIFYTPEEHDSAFGLYIPYILIGQLVGVLTADDVDRVPTLILAFHLWRFGACIALLMAVDSFVGLFLKRNKSRWFALVLTTFAGGFGWILVLVGQNDWLGTAPVEFYIPEAFSFLAIYGLPHITTARTALLLGLICLFAAMQQQSTPYAIAAGLLWSIMGLMVTFYLAVLYAVLGTWGLLIWARQRRFPQTIAIYGGIAVAVTAPLFLYSAWLFSTNEILSEWAAQNYLPSPHPLHYLVAYGGWALLAWVGLRWAWNKAQHSAPHGLLAAWVMIAPILVYLPVNVQRRLAEGIFIPIVILSVVGIRLMRKRWLVMATMVLFPSTLLFYLGSWLTVLTPACDVDLCLYRPQAEIEMLDWMDDNIPNGSVVLSDTITGNYLPIHTNLRPFAGHSPETIALEDKEAIIKSFYAGTLSPAAWEATQSAYNIRYIIWGALEQTYTDEGIPPPLLMELTPIYQAEGYTVYEVGN